MADEIPNAVPRSALSAAEYEAHVAEVIQQIDFWRGATVSRNRRFAGIRQSGMYEVDIAFELVLGGIARFLMIVDCKNHGRPVTRPAVQQLAQTRDAVGAHKAAMASASGFTAEALSVAADLGVALWVIAVNERYIDTRCYDMAMPEGHMWRVDPLYRRMRVSLLRSVGASSDAPEGSVLRLVSANRAHAVGTEPRDTSLIRHTPVHPSYCRWAVDERRTVHRLIATDSAHEQIANAILEHAIRLDPTLVSPDWRQEAVAMVRTVIAETARDDDSSEYRRLRGHRSPLAVEMDVALVAVAAGDRRRFFEAFSE